MRVTKEALQKAVEDFKQSGKTIPFLSVDNKTKLGTVIDLSISKDGENLEGLIEMDSIQ